MLMSIKLSLGWPPAMLERGGRVGGGAAILGLGLQLPLGARN